MRQGNKWLSFDNPESIREKVEFALNKKLRGAMLWSIETDDFLGLSGPKYPILKTVNYVMSQHSTANEIPTDETPTKPPSGVSSTIYSSPLLLLLFTCFTTTFSFLNTRHNL
jgi:chitinase